MNEKALTLLLLIEETIIRILRHHQTSQHLLQIHRHLTTTVTKGFYCVARSLYIPGISKEFLFSSSRRTNVCDKKKDQTIFKTDARSVCRIEEGNTNPYLTESRIIEELLKTIEPKYNASLNKIVDGDIDQDCIYVITGLISYILSCSPTGMRLNSEPYRATVEATAKILEKLGEIPPIPSIMGTSSISELLDNNEIQIEIDKKYSQAQGITSILSYINIFGNSEWEILHNNNEDSLFFTSDYPIAIENNINNTRILNKIIPLSPSVAVRIKPDMNLDNDRNDFSFSQFRYRRKKLSRQQVRAINRMIIQSAESLIFFSRKYDWIQKFVQRNSNYRIETKTENIATEDHGNFILFRQKIIKIK